jgi:hypothetical protein
MPRSGEVNPFCKPQFRRLALQPGNVPPIVWRPDQHQVDL